MVTNSFLQNLEKFIKIIWQLNFKGKLESKLGLEVRVGMVGPGKEGNAKSVRLGH
jgi:hypothetical protein